MQTKLTELLTLYRHKIPQIFGTVILSLFLLFPVHLTAQDAQSPNYAPAIVKNGENLFKGNCTVCHAIDEVIIGPALRDVHERQSEEWIYAFIKNSQKVIKSGDEYAVNLYNEYNKTLMTSFDFSEEELNAILTYIKDESNKEVQVVVADSGQSLEEGASNSVSSDELYISLGLNLLLLFIIIFVLFRFTNLSKKYVLLKDSQSKGKLLDEDDLEVVDNRFDFKKFIKSNKVVGITSFLFIAIFVKSCIDGLYTVGIQQNYQPTQPIAFSHKVHAGQYEIDCNYCHTGVNISKSANIPSVNICMNCHNAINTDKPEIQKILNA